MSSDGINHYYPAAIMAYGFSKNKKKPLRKSKVDVINIPKLITLLSSFKNSKEDLNKIIKDNMSIFFYGKKAEDIFTSMNLKEENYKEIEKIERDFLDILMKGRFQENYIFKSKKQEVEEDKILINFLKLSLKRNALFTDNFRKNSEIDNNIQYLENMEWRILESKYDCAAISDLIPISTLFLDGDILEVLNLDERFKDKNMYFLPLKSNQWVVISNDSELIIYFTEKCVDTDFKTKIFNILFTQTLMFSTQYIVVGKNHWMISLAIDILSNDEIRGNIINKRKNIYNLTRFFNTIHNLKDN